MKFLVTGSSGQVGSSVMQKVDGVGLDLHNADINQDISEDEVVDKIVAEDPDIIVHAAAFHDLDKAETAEEKAGAVNVEGTSNIAEAAEKTDSHLIFISTDYVFDGERGEYSEGEQRNPVNVYAKNKVEAEDIVLNADTQATVLRPSVIFHENFDNFFTWAKNELEENGEIGAVTDQICRPTYAPNLADIIIEAAEKGREGVYHATGDTKISRYESVQILKDEFSLDGEINRMKMKDLPWDAERPEDSSLNISKFKKEFDTKPISLAEAFRRMKE
jgi:dTDP-4-dehydrorhamnose reductase